MNTEGVKRNDVRICRAFRHAETHRGMSNRYDRTRSRPADEGPSSCFLDIRPKWTNGQVEMGFLDIRPGSPTVRFDLGGGDLMYPYYRSITALLGRY